MTLSMPPKPSSTPDVGPESELLPAMVDRQRAVLLRKVGGLGEEDLRRVMTPTGLTLLGLVKHLAFVERYWFQEVFAGLDVSYPWTDDDPDADWRPEPGESAEEIVALHEREATRSREIAAAAGLDEPAAHATERVNLRWILLHMVEELARHLGHADLMREDIDGATGD